MRSLPIVILGLLATVGAATHGGTAQTKHGNPGGATASSRTTATTIESVTRHGTSSVLALRGADATLFDVKIPAGTSIATQNEGRIMAGDLRSGDRLLLQRGGGMQDVSQRSVVMSGVVAYAPNSDTDSMTVQITSARSVLVDVDARTRITDTSHGQIGLADIVDSDTVSIHGVLDTTMDEVVVAQAVDVSGPKLTRSYTSG